MHTIDSQLDPSLDPSLDPKLEQYVVDHTQEEPHVLKALARKTWLEVLQPRMIAGAYQGRVLSMFSHMIQPTYILEIGTFTGYSAICWAEGLRDQGEIHTIDNNEELTDMAQDFVTQSGMDQNIHLHIGDAIKVIPTIQRTWDIVYIDADKTNYTAYYDAVFDRVKSGGYIIADNVLWQGKVVDPKSINKKTTKAILDFNTYIQSDTRVQNVMFSIRDGLMVVRKL